MMIPSDFESRAQGMRSEDAALLYDVSATTARRWMYQCGFKPARKPTTSRYNGYHEADSAENIKTCLNCDMVSCSGYCYKLIGCKK